MQIFLHRNRGSGHRVPDLSPAECSSFVRETDTGSCIRHVGFPRARPLSETTQECASYDFA